MTPPAASRARTDIPPRQVLETPDDAAQRIADRLREHARDLPDTASGAGATPERWPLA